MSPAKLLGLGLQIDDKLNFNVYISNICKSAASQLNVFIRFEKFMNLEEQNILLTIILWKTSTIAFKTEYYRKEC